MLLPHIKKASLTPVLDDLHFALFVFVTVIIAAGGYVINDIFDYDLDKINKPDKVFINEVFTLKKARRYYIFLNIVGFILAFYIAFHIGKIHLVLIFPAAVFLMWLYSKRLKNTVLLGNIAVSVFVAFVASVVLFAEKDNYFVLVNTASEEARFIWMIFLGYSSFAFLSNMYREIVKDMEDSFGDNLHDIKTLPVVAGNKISKIIAFFFVFLLLILLSFSIRIMIVNHWKTGIYISFFIIFPLILYSIILLQKAAEKKEFHKISLLIKVIMLSGLILLFFIV